jgi:hypothetical protein
VQTQRKVSSLAPALLAALVAASTWSAEAEASSPLPASSAVPQAPGRATEAEGVAVEPANPPPLRVGVIGGVGFPRPLAIEALAEIHGYAALGIEYGALPTITVDGVSANLWSVSGDLRVFPLRGAFYLGLRFGRQHVGATTRVAMGPFGDATEVLGLDSWFLNPRAGFLWTLGGGLTFGLEVGVQFPLGPGVTSSLPLSLYPGAQRSIETLGKSVLPTVDLLRVGLVL